MRVDVLCLVAGILVGLSVDATAAHTPERVPVIFDTDIGDDIDDTWALAMLLKSPQFDVKLITTTCHRSHARARLIAKLLTVAGRTDIPIGLGPGHDGKTRQDAWTRDFPLNKYRGKVYEDGAQAIVDTIHGSRRPITVIAVGPLQTLSAALERDPGIATKAHFVGMHGSVYRGYRGRREPSAEYNVKRDAAAARRVLLAPWRSTTITPLDTCGVVDLTGPRFQTLKHSDDPVVQALLENYRIWDEKRRGKKETSDELNRSTVLFDTVAVYLGYPGPKELVKFEQLSINVSDDGYTRVDPDGRKMAVATSWNELDRFRDLLVKILVQPMPQH